MGSRAHLCGPVGSRGESLRDGTLREGRLSTSGCTCGRHVVDTAGTHAAVAAGALRVEFARLHGVVVEIGRFARAVRCSQVWVISRSWRVLPIMSWCVADVLHRNNSGRMRWARTGRFGIYLRVVHVLLQHSSLMHSIHCIVASLLLVGKRVRKNMQVMASVGASGRAGRKRMREARAGMWRGCGGVRRDLSCVAAKSVEVGRPD